MTVRVYLARWIIPISSPPIAHAAVAVAGGRIAYVGPAAEAPEGERIDLGRAALMPGLVNAHTHLELTAMRGFLEDLDFREWIGRLTRSRESVMTDERRLAAASLGIAEGLLGGVTTYADCSDSGFAASALASHGARGVVFVEVFGPDPARCGDSMTGLTERLDAVRSDASSLIEIGVSPHAPFTVSDALFRETARFAYDRGMRIAVHASESRAEQELIALGSGDFAEALRGRGIAVGPRGRSTIEMLHRLGVLGEKTLLIHGVRMDAEDIRIAAAAGCGIAHCPASNAKLGVGIAPIVEMLESGLAVGLGTDSVASNNRMDLLDEARLATLMGRVRIESDGALNGPQVLHLATLGGARALGLDDRIGSLDLGKEADLAAFPLDGLADAAIFHPEDALVFGSSGRRASLTTIRGREVVRDGCLVASMSRELGVVQETAEELGVSGRGQVARP
jgi:cytosine/adenosine deaminase-related metal-dependent hydrolase